MLEAALPGYADVAGNRGGHKLRRPLGEVEEFCMVTLWDSMDAIRAFAGDNPEVAVFYPKDDAYLVSRDDRVAHYEVYAQITSSD